MVMGMPDGGEKSSINFNRQFMWYLFFAENVVPQEFDHEAQRKTSFGAHVAIGK